MKLGTLYDDDLIHDVANEFIGGKSLRSICAERGLMYEKVIINLKSLCYDVKKIKNKNHSKTLKHRTKRNNAEYVSFCNSKDIEVIGEYIGCNHPILHKCKKCLWEWTPSPDNVLNGSGCPPCGIKKNAMHRWLSHDEYVKRIAISNPTLVLLEQYRGGSAKLKFLCLECGYEWLKRQYDVMRGSGCPVCIVGRYGRRKMLESGVWLDSMFEYYCYMELMDIFTEDEIEIHKPYDATNFTCDFYIKPLYLYMEVSNYKSESYYAKIYMKRQMVDRFFFANNIKQIKPFLKEVYNVGTYEYIKYA